MEIDTVKEILNYGAPTAILLFILWYFVKPLGGPDGILARYFSTQNDAIEKQSHLIEAHCKVAEHMESEIRGVKDVQDGHVKETHQFMVEARVDSRDVMRLLGHLAQAATHVTGDDRAKDELNKAIEIARQYLT